MAGPEDAYEVGGRFGDDRDSLAPAQTRSDHATRQQARLVFQVPIGQYIQQFATAGVEVESGPTGGGVIERLGQCRKFGSTNPAPRQIRRLQL